jgi:arabinogalactan oligomer / maltooligosaccharide transport system substrate-binding protein
MRRITPMLALTASVALFAAACGGGSDNTDTTSEPSASDSTEAPVRGDEELVIWTDAVKYDAVKSVADQFATANDISVGV